MKRGCMAASDDGELVLCDGRTDDKKYINALETKLIQSFIKIFDNTNMESVLFQQDNAKCHKVSYCLK